MRGVDMDQILSGVLAAVNTGDGSNIILWVIILLVAVGVLVFMAKDLRKK